MFVQIRLWNECHNNCDFCCLDKDSKKKLSYDLKRSRIHTSKNLLTTMSPEKLGFIGGEFFEGQLLGVEDSWLDLMKNLNNDLVLITANLINGQYLLDETLESLNRPLLLCTSYNTNGRFHSEKQYQSWLKNIDYYHNKGVDIFCTVIVEKDLMTDKRFEELPSYLRFNLCEPMLDLHWYFDKDSIGNRKNYNELIKKFRYLTPTRKEFLSWIRKHPDIMDNYIDYENCHSDIVYSFEGENLIIEADGRTSDRGYLDECSHPYFAHFYSDSPKCAICDCEEML